MQIDKINENQLQIILNTEDLKKNNISVHSFMCKSKQSQNLCFNILNFANKKINFNIKNYEIRIDAFAMPMKSSFVLVITRIPKTAKMHISKNKHTKFTFSASYWLKFESFEDICAFCSYVKDTHNITSSLYLLHKNYFLHIKFNKIKNVFKILAVASEFTSNIYNGQFILNENAELIVRNSALQTCKTYFI